MTDTDETSHPFISVVVPMRNELNSISGCLRGFKAQTYPPDRFEVIVVDGASDDGSRQQVTAFAASHDWVRVINNPERRIPVACNLGVQHARGDIVCFFSAHGVPAQSFLASTVNVLNETAAAGVGGQCRHEGTDSRSTAIGVAMASRFGMASPARFATKRTAVDTIVFPAYHIDLLRSIGGFDETMERNEDYELNWRIRESGGTLVFDPSICSVYHPRSSLSALARQFFWYGAYKSRMLRRHPRSVKARHMVPPIAVAWLAALPMILRSPRWRRCAFASGAVYISGMATAVMDGRHSATNVDSATLAIAFPVMHFSWGVGFIAGFTRLKPR